MPLKVDGLVRGRDRRSAVQRRAYHRSANLGGLGWKVMHEDWSDWLARKLALSTDRPLITMRKKASSPNPLWKVLVPQLLVETQSMDMPTPWNCGAGVNSPSV